MIRSLLRNDLIYFIPVLVLGTAFALVVPGFGTWGNAGLILSQAAPLIIIALAQMFVLMTGGFDISVGAVAALVSVVTALACQQFGFAAALAAGLLTGVLAGTINGLNVAVFGVQPVIATLGMLLAGRGLSLLLAPMPVTGLPKQLLEIGYGSFWGLPISVWIALVLVIIVEILIRRTAWLRAILAVGGSESAARLNGISVRTIKLSAYAATGLLSAFAAILYTARANSGQPNLGVGLELDAITAAVIGGVSLLGGKGRAVGACAGALILAELANGMSLADISPFLQQVITGTVLIFYAIILFNNHLFRGFIIRKKKIVINENLNGGIVEHSKL
ncbi:ABC transporter permease [Paenibacillus beijingensis]|uniref:ABC transporter permease n=1 Tax=Paenibacillus beijingensis TaxID=1126833 RepID=UPI000696149A|nr:ABC transporter permease [Paenibacillus beijingensis]